MNGEWFLFYTKILSKPNGFGAELKTVLALMRLEATTEEAAMIEAQKKWAVISWGEPKGIRINPYIAQFANVTPLK